MSEFFAMGGYAFYVWGSVGACAVAMIVEPWLVRRHHRRILRSLGPRRGAGAPAHFPSVTAEGTR